MTILIDFLMVKNREVFKFWLRIFIKCNESIMFGISFLGVSYKQKIAELKKEIKYNYLWTTLNCLRTVKIIRP